MPDALPTPEAAEQKRAEGRARVAQNAGRTAWHLARMAENAVRLGMTPQEVATLHYAATIGEVFPLIPPETEAPHA
jgi:hypothetical protein